MLLTYAKKSSPGFLEKSTPVMTTCFVSGVCLQAPASNSVKVKYKSLFMVDSLGNFQDTQNRSILLKIENGINQNLP
jgi:hypothetical protein